MSKFLTEKNGLEFLTEYSFYKIGDVIHGYPDKIQISTNDEPLKIMPTIVLRNQVVNVKFNIYNIKKHKVRIKNLNYFSDILDKLGSDAYVVFPSDSFFYKSALVNELIKRIFYNDYMYNPNRDTHMHYKNKNIPIIYLLRNNEFCDADYYDYSDYYDYYKYCIPEYKLEQPYVWITNGRDLTYGFNG